MNRRREQVRTALRWTLAAVYLAAGIGHLWVPEKFLAITPDSVPAPGAVIFITGLCEIAGAGALLTHRWRRIAAIMLAAYAVCVFPEPDQARDRRHSGISSMLDSWWYHAPRLAFQPVLVWWPLFCAGVIDWPTRR